MTKDARSLLLLAGLALATTLPFVNRAYFVDDYYFVTMAKGILEHPGRPYDFKSNDAGIGNAAWERGKPPRMVNPPLFHYYLAAVIRGFGESESVLRASLIPWSILALVAMFYLGKRFSAKPFEAAALMAITPIYWLTSFSLLIDAMLLAFVLWGLWIFIVAHEKRSLKWAAWAGLLLAMATLVKYFGVIGIVVAALWQLMDGRRRTWRGGLITVGVFVLLHGLWALWNILTYGQPHLLATFSRGMGSVHQVFTDKCVVTASFFGGGTLWALAGYPYLWKRSRLSAGLILFGVFVGIFILSSRTGGFTLSQSIQLALWISAAAAFVISVLFLWGERAGPDRFLILWFLVAMLELLVVMPWTAGRYFLCALPPACWLLIRLIPGKDWNLWGRAWLSVTAVMGLCLARADYLQANTIRQLAQELHAPLGNQAPRYYLGDTFAGYGPYLEPLGWQAAFPDQVFKAGDLILAARYRRSSWWRLPATLHLTPMTIYEFRSPLPFRVLDIPSSAGWYASVWGSLPWVITRDPLERFEIYRVL